MCSASGYTPLAPWKDSLFESYVNALVEFLSASFSECDDKRQEVFRVANARVVVLGTPSAYLENEAQSYWSSPISLVESLDDLLKFLTDGDRWVWAETLRHCRASVFFHELRRRSPFSRKFVEFLDFSSHLYDWPDRECSSFVGFMFRTLKDRGCIAGDGHSYVLAFDSLVPEAVEVFWMGQNASPMALTPYTDHKQTEARPVHCNLCGVWWMASSDGKGELPWALLDAGRKVIKTSGAPWRCPNCGSDSGYVVHAEAVPRWKIMVPKGKSKTYLPNGSVRPEEEPEY